MRGRGLALGALLLLLIPGCGTNASGVADGPPSPDARVFDAPPRADAPPTGPDAASGPDASTSPDASAPSPDAPPAPLTIDPDTHDFGAVVLGDQPSFTFAVQNPADVASAPLTISIDNDGATDAFLVGAFSTCAAAPLAAHTGCSVIVVFAPTADGPATGTLHVDAGTTHLTASLMGTGVTAGVLGADPDSLTFDPLVVGQMSGSRTVKITNTGESASGAISVTLTGSNAASFMVSSGCDGMSLDTQESCSFTVTFAPVLRGDNAASIEVQAVPGGTTTIAVDGQGLAPALLGTSADHDFGTVPVGSKQSFDFPITNSGDVATGKLQLVAKGNKVQLTVTDDCPSSLGPGDGCTVTISYAPLALGMSALEVDISAAPGGSIVLTASGTAVAAASLTVIPPDGVTVTSDPEGIDCGDTCTHTYAAGTMVELTATADGSAASVIAWQGDCDGVDQCGPSPTCLVTVTASCLVRPVVAGPGQAALELDRSGAGSVRSTPAGIECVDPLCTMQVAPFDVESTVVLTPFAPISATPGTFANVQWQGCDDVDDMMRCSVTVPAEGATVGYSCTPTRPVCEHVIVFVDDGCGSLEPCLPPPPN